jgi:peptidoglycan/xylan/chitin deacetylase (PgdA/CDA1 family)
MLTFRNTNWVFGLLLIFLIGYNIAFRLPIYVYFILIFVYLSLLVYGSYFIRAGFYLHSVCSAATDRKEIALSFDDGPANAFTPDILALLKENNIEAAFFCVGNRILGNETLLKQVHEEGHIIGNHSFSHARWFALFPARKMLADMKLMDLAMNQETGLTPRLFRPPYGVTNPTIRKAVSRGNYISVGWNIRSFDTKIKNDKRLLRRVTKRVKPGAIVLFHDTSKTTLNILPEFIRKLKQDGYTISRLDKMLKLEPYA